MRLKELLQKKFREHIQHLWDHPEVQHIQDTQVGTTDQGRRHCGRVDSHLGRLLTATNVVKRLSHLELYFLSAAAALHDIGTSRNNEIVTYVKDLPFHVRQDHGLIAQHILTKSFLRSKLFLDREHARVVGEIVSVHDSGNMYLVTPDTEHLGFPSTSRGSYEVRPRLLAGIFRLADMIDCSYERSPELEIATDEVHDGTTRVGRRYTSTWEIHPGYPKCIYFRPIYTDEKTLDIVYDEINNLNCQMTPEHMEVLRMSSIAVQGRRGADNPLPYRFLCEKDLLVRTASDVFPVHPALQDISPEYLRFYLEESRKIRNPVIMLHYGISVEATQSYFSVQYRLKGVNVGHQPLGGIVHPVAGDTPVQFEELGIRAYVKVKQGNRWSQRRSVTVEAQDRCNKRIKILQIPFGNKVPPGEEFEINLTYGWPEIWSQRESLWWIDDLYSYGRTRKLEMEVSFKGLTFEEVSGFCVDTNSFVTRRLRQHDVQRSAAGFRWAEECPADRCLVVFACRTRPT